MIIAPLPALMFPTWSALDPIMGKDPPTVSRDPDEIGPTWRGS